MRLLLRRTEVLWIAALVHRLSGLSLSLFLPLHFLALGLAINGEDRLDGFLRWTDLPIVKIAEGGLVALLCIHLLGGIRLLLIENFSWRSGQKFAAWTIGAASFAAAFIFLIRVF